MLYFADNLILLLYLLILPQETRIKLLGHLPQQLIRDTFELMNNRLMKKFQTFKKRKDRTLKHLTEFRCFLFIFLLLLNLLKKNLLKLLELSLLLVDEGFKYGHLKFIALFIQGQSFFNHNYSYKYNILWEISYYSSYCGKKYPKTTKQSKRKDAANDKYFFNPMIN